MKYQIWLLLFGLLSSCTKKPEDLPAKPEVADNFIRAVDISLLPVMEREGTVWYNEAGNPENMLATLKKAGCNTVRVRLWKNPMNAISSLTEVHAFAQRIKAVGMKVWLCVHYSDTWADPANQLTPTVWQNLDFQTLSDSVYQYTKQITAHIKPDIIQIGNEINNGFLLPQGSLSQMSNFRLLLASGIKATREQLPKAKIMLHFAGIENAEWFYSQMSVLDYDWIGLSYYPIWHGKDLTKLSQAITDLKNTYQKEVMVAETSYPFTFGWNDWTNNVVGNDSQILTAYPATSVGQKDYLQALKQLVKQAKGIGFCYWGAEWVAFRGNQSQNGSPWENQALYDFNNRALPILQVFQGE